MISKYVIGKPFETNSFTKKINETKELKYFSAKPIKDGIIFSYTLDSKDRVYGLGETMGKFNKRGSSFISFNLDNPHHKEDTKSLYGSHNFLIIEGKTTFGIFFDTPARVDFDIDVNNSNEIKVVVYNKNIRIYVIENTTSYLITRDFLDAIGQSYLPPLWAFGYGQSRWGYKNEKDINKVIEGYKKANIPLDYVCMDIDYMDRFIDFTINKERFPDLKKYQSNLLKDGIHLVPIIDCGVKIEPGNKVYEEGVKNNYFCKNKDDKYYKAAVWPGFTHFPNFYNSDVRKWFGSKYKILTDAGIEGFWNDMNEPAIFYSEYSKSKTNLNSIAGMLSFKEAETKTRMRFEEEYRNFYHEIDGVKYPHIEVHNAYGMHMTMASNEGLSKLLKKRFLLFSRSSYIGASRYGGIWTGDNNSCFMNLKYNIYQMPSLNMCGFIYSGADTGGFGGNSNRELMLRWLAVSLFTPLMRNHSALGTMDQECYRFDHTNDFKDIISLRYQLLPYIYSEFMKAALNKDMYIKPLSFVFEDDKVKDIEDQLIVGESIMIAPISDKGVMDREVYLPTNMTKVTYNGKEFKQEYLSQGTYSIHMELNEVVFFILDNKLVPVSNQEGNANKINLNEVILLGNGSSYEQYIDDGTTRNCNLKNIVVRTKKA